MGEVWRFCTRCGKPTKRGDSGYCLACSKDGGLFAEDLHLWNYCPLCGCLVVGAVYCLNCERKGHKNPPERPDGLPF
jgi:hypothetical protein